MSRNLSPERRKAVLCACAAACMAGLPTILRHHRAWMFCGIAVQMFFLVAAIVLLSKASQKRQNGEERTMTDLAQKRQRLFYLALLSGALTLLGQLLLKGHRPLQLTCEAVTVSFGLCVVLALLRTDREEP